MQVERSNAGPPKQVCKFDTDSGQLLITVEDPQTGKAAAACALTLTKPDATRLADALDAFCLGGNKPEPFSVVHPAADPFVRVCTFHAPSGELAVSLAYKGAIKLAADATIVLARPDDDPACAQPLADGLREFARH